MSQTKMLGLIKVAICTCNERRGVNASNKKIHAFHMCTMNPHDTDTVMLSSPEPNAHFCQLIV